MVDWHSCLIEILKVPDKIYRQQILPCLGSITNATKLLISLIRVTYHLCIVYQLIVFRMYKRVICKNYSRC